jgi:copper chaperone CopZ
MRAPDDLNRTRIFVPAMDCPDEEKEIRAALSRLPAVESLTFHLFSRQVEVDHRGEVDTVLDALRRIGMEGHPEDPCEVQALSRDIHGGCRYCGWRSVPRPRCMRKSVKNRHKTEQ